MSSAAQDPSDIGKVQPVRRLMVLLATMSATMMQLLDTTIVNVALPRMQSQLSSTPAEITWVLTTYIIAISIIMPLTGYLADKFGQRRFFLYAVTGFLVASVLCGLALSLQQLVAFRIFQGVAGAALVPLSQAIITGLYSIQERGKAMALWGLSVALGPVLGPTVGGWITEELTWRWIFFINVPIGVVSLFLALRALPDSPRRERRMDWVGFALSGIAVAALQFCLDHGTRLDWFDSVQIQLSGAVFLIFAAMFIHHMASGSPHLLFAPKLFLDLNFTKATIAVVGLSVVMFGAMVLQPIFLQSWLNYPASTAGFIMAPRSIAVAVCMAVVGKLSARFAPRTLVLAGITCILLGTVTMSRYTLEVGLWTLIWPGLLYGAGIALVTVPLSVYAFATLPKEVMAEAAGLQSLLRNIGTSIGVSAAAALYVRYEQQSWQQLIGYVTTFSIGAREYLEQVSSISNDSVLAGLLVREVATQAAVAAFSKTYLWIAAVVFLMYPVALLIGSRRASSRA